MSDSCSYELEDIAWDEFGLSDDHTVPHPSRDHANELLSLPDTCKKPWYEVIGLSKPIGYQFTQKYANQREEKELPPLNSRSTTMLEKYSLTDVPDAPFPSKHDKHSVKEFSSSASENTGTSSHCFSSNNIDSTSSEFLPSGPILDDKNAAIGGNSYSYLLGPISHADDDLSFFDSNREDKNTNDILYYSLPEIENFEGVGRIFRSCDSTFGLEASIEDDLGWFSSSDVTPGGGLRSDFEFPCPASSAPENISGLEEAFRPKEAGTTINDSGTKDQHLSHNGSSLPSEDESAILSPPSFVNESNDSDYETVPENKIVMHKKHSIHQNQSEGKRKDVCLENGETFNYNDGLLKEIKLPTAINGTQVDLRSTSIQQQRQVDGPDFGYSQGGISYLHSDYSHSDQTTVCPTQSIIKSENNSLMRPSAKDSCATNLVQWKESSPDPSVQVAGIGNEKNVDKLLHHSGMKLENNGDLEGVSMVLPAELRSSIVKEMHLIGFGVDDISAEAASFHQLQHIMERLDIRTKLCIRDSLYRLAQSAEQRHRHQHGNLDNGSGDDRQTSGAFVDVGANRCTGCLDMETDTNSIDRSIAHLLFHRPSKSSVMPNSDSLALKSPSMVGVSAYACNFHVQQTVFQNLSRKYEQIYGSLTTPPMMGGNLTSAGEKAAQTDEGVADQ